MKENDEMQRVIRVTLIRLGIKCDLIGYSYLADAIQLVAQEPTLTYDMQKVFQSVAEKYSAKSAFRVEANIQNALTQAFNTKGFGYINKLYGMEILKPKYKPTTAEFIKLVAEYVNLGLYKSAI